MDSDLVHKIATSSVELVSFVLFGLYLSELKIALLRAKNKVSLVIAGWVFALFYLSLIEYSIIRNWIIRKEKVPIEFIDLSLTLMIALKVCCLVYF